jgi:hypothetical protein
MSTIDRVGIKEKLVASIDREGLPNREAARLLNIHPCYISMIKNEKSWDSIPPKIWTRFNEWFEGREMLKSFQIPDGEEIYKLKEKAVKPGVNEEIKPVYTNLNEKELEVKKEVAVILKKERKQGTKKAIYTEDFVRELEAQLAFKENLLHSALLQLEDKSKKNYALAADESKPSLIPEFIKQKLMLDIEINLTINGHKVSI